MSWPAALGGRGRGGPGPVTDRPVTGRPQWSGPVASDVVLPPAGDEAVRELARAGLARFNGQGIHLEIVRSRPNCLVVRSTVHAQVDATKARAFVNEAGVSRSSREPEDGAAGTDRRSRRPEARRW